MRILTNGAMRAQAAGLTPVAYPGDYQTMLYTYANDYEGETAFDRVFHKLTTEHPLANDGRPRRFNAEDANRVSIYLAATDAAKLEAFLSSTDLMATMKNAGVKGPPHIAAITAEGIDGCEALVTHAATGDITVGAGTTRTSSTATALQATPASAPQLSSARRAASSGVS